MNPETTLSPADILAEVIESDGPTLSPQFAEKLLSLRFNDTAQARMRALLQRNNAGTITQADKATLDNYLRVGEFLDLLQAKARITLQDHPSQAA